MRTKKQLVPPELNEPFPIGDLITLRRQSKVEPFSLEDPLRFELKRRTLILAEWLDQEWPNNENEWLRFVSAVFSELKLPGFTFKTAGAPPKWSARTDAQLVEDVRRLIKNNRHMTPHAACLHIVRHRDKFNNRYSQNYKTLYDRYRRLTMDLR